MSLLFFFLFFQGGITMHVMAHTVLFKYQRVCVINIYIPERILR